MHKMDSIHYKSRLRRCQPVIRRVCALHRFPRGEEFFPEVRIGCRPVQASDSHRQVKASNLGEWFFRDAYAKPQEPPSERRFHCYNSRNLVLTAGFI